MNYAPRFNPLLKNDFKKKANISVYAHQKDYHVVIGKQLKEFKNWLYTEHKLDSKYFVDSSPVMEKYFAKKTKVGWLGKHTNIVSKEYGSWLFLSEIFLPISLTVDKKKMITVVHAEVVLIFVPPMRLFQIIKLMLENVFHI